MKDFVYRFWLLIILFGTAAIALVAAIITEGR